jgi:hypothetical protein
MQSKKSSSRPESKDCVEQGGPGDDHQDDVSTRSEGSIGLVISLHSKQGRVASLLKIGRGLGG